MQDQEGDLVEVAAPRIQVRDLIPLTIGLEVLGGQMLIIIKRNTEKPCSGVIELETTSDNQE